MIQSEMILYVGGNIKYAKIGVKSTQIVNKNYGFGFMFFTIPIFLVNVVLNMAVMKILWKEEKTIVNQLMMVDSMVNIVYSLLSTIHHPPYYRGMDLQVFCYPHLVLTVISMIGNRLMPVTIVIFR